MKRYWLAFAIVVLCSFSVLGWAGVRIYQQMAMVLLSLLPVGLLQTRASVEVGCAPHVGGQSRAPA